jgi:hypothetical protein
MRYLLLTCLLPFTVFLTVSPAQAQPRPDLSQLQRLQLSDSQVQGLFSIFLSRAPSLLGDSAQAQDVLREIAPQALSLLNQEQRSFLQELAPEEQIQRFGSMTRDERKRFMFDSARSLVHPSKQKWIERAEDMVNDSSGL